MQGQIVFLRCHHCDLPIQNQFGADIRFCEHVEDYYRLGGVEQQKDNRWWKPK